MYNLKIQQYIHLTVLLFFGVQVKIFYEYTIITKEGHSWYEATIKAYLTILTKTRLKVKDHRESKTIVCVYYFHPDSASIKYESNTAFQSFFAFNEMVAEKIQGYIVYV